MALIVGRTNTQRRPSRSSGVGVGLSFRTSLWFVLPSVVLFAVFVLYPLLAALSYSFFEWTGPNRGPFVGLQNYVTILTQPPYAAELGRAFLHNLLLFVGALAFQNTLGLGIAALLHRRKRTKRLFQTLYTLPYLVSPLVIGYLWSLMLSPLFGPVNAFLRGVGLEGWALPWLGDSDLALWVVILVSTWQWIGFPILLYGAAIGGIPEEVDEAAEMDGATAFKRFRYITVPMLTPTIGIVTVLAFIASMEAFTIPYAFGGSSGSPAGATDVMMLLFYRTAFQSTTLNSTGLSSALATLLFLFIFIISIVIVQVSRWVERKLF